MQSPENYPIAVLGAGPVGLAAAAHLTEYGLTPLIFEAAPSVGASFRDFGHVRLFSPWRYNVDGASRRLLEPSGWTLPDEDALPTAREIAERYLEPLAATQPIRQHLLLNARVIGVARSGYDKVKSEGRENAPFVVRAEVNGVIQEFLAGAVIDATGNWSHPNPLGANGLPAIGEAEFQDRIRYGMPDVLGGQRARYAGKTVLVVGAGHSAVGSLVALAELAESEPDTRIHWALRGSSPARAFGGGEADQLPARGQLGIRLQALIERGVLQVHTGFRVHAIRRQGAGMSVVPEALGNGAQAVNGVDEIICATGSRPDLDMVRELRVRTDVWLESAEALAPLIDPNLHSCGTVRPHGHRELAHPEPGFYMIGAKSYGRAPTFLMATGYEQARSVVAALAGDLAAADDVRLELPETGVCVTGNPGAGSCCVTPVAVQTKIEATGNDGCGCSAPAPTRAQSCCG